MVPRAGSIPAAAYRFKARQCGAWHGVASHGNPMHGSARQGKVFSSVLLRRIKAIVSPRLFPTERCQSRFFNGSPRKSKVYAMNAIRRA